MGPDGEQNAGTVRAAIEWALHHAETEGNTLLAAKLAEALDIVVEQE